MVFDHNFQQSSLKLHYFLWSLTQGESQSKVKISPSQKNSIHPLKISHHHLLKQCNVLIVGKSYSKSYSMPVLSKQIQNKSIIQIFIFKTLTFQFFLIFLCKTMQTIHPSHKNYPHLNISRLDTGGSTTLRSGDWICLNCNNFNYSFRNLCNRCKQQSKSKNYELQNIIKNLEQNLLVNPQILQKSQEQQKSVPKIWFNDALQTSSFPSALFLFVSEPTAEFDMKQHPLREKVCINSQAGTDISDDDMTTIQCRSSSSSSFSWEASSILSEETWGQYFSDQYLLSILKD